MPHSKSSRPKVDIAAMIDAVTPETLHLSPWGDDDFDDSLVGTVSHLKHIIPNTL